MLPAFAKVKYQNRQVECTRQWQTDGGDFEEIPTSQHKGAKVEWQTLKIQCLEGEGYIDITSGYGSLSRISSVPF